MRLILLSLVLLAAAWLLWPRAGAPGVSVLGDGAPVVAAALDVPEGASVDVVLLRRSGAIRHLPETAQLCRGRCGPGLTVLRVLGPGGGARLVFEMSEMEGVTALDRGAPLPAPLAACIAQAVAVETRGEGGWPSCLGARRAHLVLPYGL